MRKGQKNPHTKTWNKKISEGVKKQWADGRGNLSGLHSQKTLEKISGSKNYAWKGENVGYTCLHQWIRRLKGKPQKCEICGTTNKRKYEWANINHRYLRNLNDYVRMCTSCHRKYDIEHNNTSPNQHIKR